MFLGELAKLRKTTISFVMSVRPSVRIEQLGSHRAIFMKFYIIFRKSVEKILVSLTFGKNNGHFTLRQICIYDRISLNCFYHEKYCSQKL